MFLEQDEWFNLRLEKSVSYDLFLAIHMLVTGSKSDAASKVGSFVMMMLQGDDENWDDGIIVHEVICTTLFRTTCTFSITLRRSETDSKPVLLYYAQCEHPA